MDRNWTRESMMRSDGDWRLAIGNGQWAMGNGQLRAGREIQLVWPSGCGGEGEIEIIAAKTPIRNLELCRWCDSCSLHLSLSDPQPTSPPTSGQTARLVPCARRLGFAAPTTATHIRTWQPHHPNKSRFLNFPRHRIKIRQSISNV
jgi:hypothetical protein